MSDTVTFTPEQTREIHRRINERTLFQRSDIIAAFPFPKVTRYRTFDWNHSRRRVVGAWVEFEDAHGKWHANGSISDIGNLIIAEHNWTVLAAFADVAARPTEEVDA